jgi:hypothetical protein
VKGTLVNVFIRCDSQLGGKREERESEGERGRARERVGESGRANPPPKNMHLLSLKCVISSITSRVRVGLTKCP